METEFKVGDKVKSVYGSGIIVDISKNDTSYPIIVRYKDGTILTYTINGKQFHSSDYSDITKIIWEVGQRVFSANYGWGTISEISNTDYPIHILFDKHKSAIIVYGECGRELNSSVYPDLSFTNYIKDKFSQDPKDATYEQIEPDFDWGCLSAWCNDWIAKDKDGIWYSFNGKPELLSEIYFPGDAFTRIHSNYFPKNSDKIDWEKSLFKNPNK